MSAKPRLLIFVIAYYAEDTLKSVLERIPQSIFDEYHSEILIVDDASHDRTEAIGRAYRREQPGIAITVLRNEFNQGYGGNQKVGYAFAIREGFDFVAMLHGDGQYAPEELPKLVAPLRDRIADAVFGTRMMRPIKAAKTGMPLYKLFGNRILTALQNLMLAARFSEFHSSYRAYSVDALKRIAFQFNTNSFHFDTEIIIQLRHAGRRVLEVPIPTYYGNEISRVNGIKYAKDVLVTTAQSVLHDAGLLYQRRFDPISLQESPHYDLKLGYTSSHQLALDAVPDGTSVIDIGAGPGGVARELLKKRCRVAVVDQFAVHEALNGNVHAFTQNLDDELTFSIVDYEYLLLLDIIEHLKNPETFLGRLRAQFDYTTKTLVLTTPNIAFAVQRAMLVLGQFNYGKAGILDRTHTRLFTFRSLRRLLVDYGFRIRQIRGVPAPFPKVFGNGRMGRAALAVNRFLIALSPSLFAYQIFVVAHSTPDVDFVLDDAKRRSALRDQRAGTPVARNASSRR